MPDVTQFDELVGIFEKPDRKDPSDMREHDGRNRHRESKIEIGRGWAKDRNELLLSVKHAGHADRAHTREDTEPIGKQNKEKQAPNNRQEQYGSCSRARALVKIFADEINCGLGGILQAVRHFSN